MDIKICPNCQTPNRSSARFCVACATPLEGATTSPTESDSRQVQKLAIGSLLQGRYRIEEELGRGGFGAVYRAWDINLNRFCALKENLDTSPEAQRQFAREATVLANLSHPNLPRVTDHFLIEGQGQYLVMDFIEGEDLASLVGRQGAVPLNQALGWISQIADALEYLHHRQPPVVHRDIKPSNIRITPEGKAILVDFGLVKVYSPHLKTTLGARAVTPGYAPPEQYGQGSTDVRTDVYALGATLYALLTGKEPLESVQRMAGVELSPAHRVSDKVPEAIGMAIERAMALDPARRFQSAAEFRLALQQGGALPKVGAQAPTMAVSSMTERAATARPREVVKEEVVAVPGREKKRLFTGVGLGAIILLCLGAAIVGSLLIVGWLQDQEYTSQTQTAESRSATKTKAARNVRETEQAQIEATDQARLDFLSSARQWAQESLETFDNNDRGWPVGDKSSSEGELTRSIADGKYRWVANATENDFSWLVYYNDTDVANFYLSVELQQLAGPGDAKQGVVFRYTQTDDVSQYYSFMVTNDGRYLVIFQDGDNWEEILPLADSSAILIDQPNWMEVIGESDHFKLYINAQYVNEFFDQRLTHGSVGISIRLPYLGDQATWVFDNFELRLP